MRMTFFLLLLFISTSMTGQTDSIEIASLNNKLVYKQIDETEFSKIRNQWDQKMKNSQYPSQPLDQNGEVHYVYIKEFRGLNRDYLFNRTLEWLSINYGLMPSAFYSRVDDGKIIFRNSLNLYRNYSCVPTTIITIKEGKMRIEQISITYQLYNKGDYSSGIPESLTDVSVYPVILKKNSEWNMNLYLLGETRKLFDREVQNLKDYIDTFDYSDIF